MNKITYLKQLKASLREKYLEPQVQDILADYEEFFSTGAAEGKSEAELCSEFGPPEQAACELKNEAQKPQYIINRFIFACLFLSILIFAFLWLYFDCRFEFASISSNSDGPVSFWYAVLFPLALEGILALWASQNIPRKKSLNWIPRANIILNIPVASVIILFFYLSFTMPSEIEEFHREGPSGPIRLLMATAHHSSIISMFLLLASIVLLMLYAIRGHEKARWFLFLDTTLQMLLLNLHSFVGHIGPNDTYDSVKGIASCFLWAVLPNLAALGIYWVIRKIVLLRKAAFHRAKLSNRT